MNENNAHLTSDELAALAWGIAGEQETAAWRAHLSTCEPCRAALAADQMLLDGLEELEVPILSHPRWNAMIRSALEDANPAPRGAYQAALRAQPRRWPAWGLRAAAFFAVFLVGYHFGVNRASRNESHDPLDPPPAIHVPAAPAGYLPLSPGNSVLTTSTKSRYLLVRAEDKPC